MDTSKRSKVWLHFSIVSVGSAKCNICGSKYSFKGGSTSNLKKHLLLKHHTVLTKTDSSFPQAHTSQQKTEGNVKMFY